MALNSSGPISLGGATSGQSIALELGQSATGQISLNDTNVRTLAGVASGAIIMPTNFYGKSNRVTVNLTVSGNTQNYNIFSNKGGSYVAGKTDIILTINAGVIVGSSSTGGYSLDTGTGWTSGDTIKIVNNGSIVGCGGNGGASGVNGSPGGTALRLQYATSIQNNSTIGGGGGGGAGGSYAAYIGGGGAGNSVGTGSNNGTTTNGGNSTYGGAGGAAGVAGGVGYTLYCCDDHGCYVCGSAGGGGGGLGAAGGYSVVNGKVGGAAGAATNGAGTYATWLATGTRYGTIG